MAKKKTTLVDLGTPKIHNKSDKEIAFLFEKFIEQHPNELSDTGMVDPARVVDWAFDTGIYKPKPVNPRAQLRSRVSRHLGHRYMIDPQGRTVRALLAVPVTDTDEGGNRRYGYFPLFQTEPERVEMGLKLRRIWAYKRVEQIDVDRESYNDNNIFGATIEQLDFNFEQTLQDAKMPTEWSDTPPDDIDDEDDN